MTWRTLGEVLGAKPPPPVTVCSRGHHLPLPAPVDLVEMRAYLRIGVGIAMRHAQRCDARLAGLATDVEREIGGEVQVQVFVTPAETHGFGWHYDEEDVFIVQTLGAKDYVFRENTVAVDTPFPPRDFTAYHRETSPLQTACLIPGDFLYIPARWWHMAVARETSLSISIGVRNARSS